MTRRPLIGISTYQEQARWGVWEQQAALLPQSYVAAVTKAGGTPVLLPPLTDHPEPDVNGNGVRPAPAGVAAATAADLAGAVDALVLSGGADVDPVHYGAEPHPHTVTRPERDAWELALVRAALAARLPVLAICRGMQVLNVACGGTLHQHLPDVVDHAEHQPAPGQFGVNVVRITPASRLAGIVGRRATVMCHHHQAVDVLGAGLEPAAWATDRTVEAIEHFEHDFVVGVQWHPEEGAGDTRLFAALVRATRPGDAQPARPARRSARTAPIQVRDTGRAAPS